MNKLAVILLLKMKQEVTAQDMKGIIASQGKIALYGILPDTGK